MIRDTSAQDRQLSPKINRKKRLIWIGVGAAGLLAVIAVMPTVAHLMSADSSASTARLRIAEVKRGTLTRDVSVQGRVVAAVSPTLYARSAGTVSLEIHAGDKVKKGDVLATIESPELANKLKQEQSTLDSLTLDVERAGIDHRKQQLTSKKTLDQARIDRQTAEREVQRTSKAFTAGALPELDLLRAKDSLAKTDITVLNAEQESLLERDSLAFELKTKRLALDRQKLLVEDVSRQVDELKVRSPVDGQVGQLIVQQRANVAANAPILTVVDLTALEVEVQVSEVFAHDLSIGMPAEIQDMQRQVHRRSQRGVARSRQRPGHRPRALRREQAGRPAPEPAADHAHPDRRAPERADGRARSVRRHRRRPRRLHRARRRRRAHRDPGRRDQPEFGRDRFGRQGRRPRRDFRHG